MSLIYIYICIKDLLFKSFVRLLILHLLDNIVDRDRLFIVARHF